MITVRKGEKFGRLTVLADVSGTWNTPCECRCICGTITSPRIGNLKSNNTKSCGCTHYETKNTTHGESKTKLYAIWCSMKGRCTYPSYTGFENYGGRGISVCDEWAHDFVTFKKWAIANGYRDGLTIDRKDMNGNYSPDNCRWATYKEQNNNRRNNHLVEYQGQTKTVTQWAEYYNIKPKLLFNRLRRGWEIERALTEKPKGARHDWHNKTDHRLAV